MKIERKAKMTRPEANSPGESPEVQAAGAGSELVHVSPVPGSTNQYADQARAIWMEAQDRTPLEIRSQRIAALKAAIASGTYQVSAEQTAEAILSERQIRNGTAA